MASAAVLQHVLQEGREKQLPECQASERLAWVMEMRAQFSPKGMLAEDGSINQEFFKPKTLVIVEDKKWGDAERDLLYKGIEKYGIGGWNDISAELLPKWDDQAIRVKASRLMGSQSLARYVGWKGSKAAVDAEYAANKALGERLGCWKAGVLVEDGAGSVKKALAAAGQAAASLT